MVRPQRQLRLAEPVHDVAEVRRVEVAERRHFLDARPGAVESLDTGEDVDDRLGGQAGDGSAPDVMDPANDPGADALLQVSTLSLEFHRPARIIGGEVPEAVPLPPGRDEHRPGACLVHLGVPEHLQPAVRT
jgi:hypothetical protein